MKLREVPILSCFLVEGGDKCVPSPLNGCLCVIKVARPAWISPYSLVDYWAGFSIGTHLTQCDVSFYDVEAKGLSRCMEFVDKMAVDLHWHSCSEGIITATAHYA